MMGFGQSVVIGFTMFLGMLLATFGIVAGAIALKPDQGGLFVGIALAFAVVICVGAAGAAYYH